MRVNRWGMRLFFVAILAGLLATGGLTAAAAGDATLLGTGFGAIAGGLIGNQFGHGAGRFAFTTLGVATGATLGNDLGRSIDYANASYAGGGYSGASYTSYDSAVAVRQPYKANYVAPVAPSPIYEDGETGAFCRAYSRRVHTPSGWQEEYGTACLEPDGSWRRVE
jgi:surface antigen